jgi:putative glutamine amidotransferase
LPARPLIAVTTSEVRRSEPQYATPEADPPQQEMALGMRYLRAIEAAGGIPVVVPPLRADAADELLERVSGVCLSGGPDLDPVAYGACEHERLGPRWRELDDFELSLARAADARRLPILAVCRGLQVLNVARGGTLHQHLPDVVGEQINHRQQAPAATPTHWVTFTADCRLTSILGRRRAKVNSFHHQAVDELGERLVITGRAGDRTVESVEATDREFVVAVQWHAECMADRADQAALFRALVEAAERFETASGEFAAALAA